MKKFAGIIFLCSFLLPLNAKACNVRPYAKNYITKIHAVLGGTKPSLLIEKGISKKSIAYYGSKKIHIYKKDYPGNCSDQLPYLKSVIAHEYSHHIAKQLRAISSLRGEKLAYVSEHSIGDVIFGKDKIEYDNDKEVQYKEDYAKIKNYVLKMQAKKIAKEKARERVYAKRKLN